MMLHALAARCEGLSGRALRKLPFLAHANLIAATATVGLEAYLDALQRSRADAVQPGQCPSSAPVPPQGTPGSMGAQPLPRLLERAASKAAHFPAFAHLALPLPLPLPLTRHRAVELESKVREELESS